MTLITARKSKLKDKLEYSNSSRLSTIKYGRIINKKENK